MNRVRCLARGLLLCVLMASVTAHAVDDWGSLRQAEAYVDDHLLTTPLSLTGQTVPSFAQAFGALDLSRLGDGPHTLYLHFRDSAGAWSQAIGQSFHLPARSATGVEPGSHGGLVAAEAYIDEHRLPTTLTLMDKQIPSFAQALGTMDLSGLDPGRHTVYLRLQDRSGAWSQPIGQALYIPEAGDSGVGLGSANGLVAAEAFIDDDPGAGRATAIATALDGSFDTTAEAFLQSFPVADLKPGNHTLYLRFRDRNGNWSNPLGQSFYRHAGPFQGGQAVGTHYAISAAEAFFDTDPGEGNGLPLPDVADGAIDDVLESLGEKLDITALEPGFHTLYLRARDSAGRWSPAIAQSLYLSPDKALSSGDGPGAAVITAADYAIDAGGFNSAPAADGAFGGLVEEVNLERSVGGGNHSFEVRFSDSLGRHSSRQAPTDIHAGDQDWDGLPDAWERAELDGTGQNGRGDPDGDGLTNLEEFLRGTDPLVSDLPQGADGPELIDVPDLDGKAVGGALFVDARNPDASLHLRFRTFFLEKAGVNVAQFSANQTEGAITLGYALWTDMDGKPLERWSQVLTENTPVPFRLVAQLDDDSYAVSNTFHLRAQNGLTSSFQATPPLPRTGPDVPVTLTAGVNGGDGDYHYRWLIGGDYLGPGGLARSLGEQAEVTTLLADGSKWWTYGGVVLTLRVDDSAGNVSFSQRVVAVDEPYTTGDPGPAGVPAVRGVAMLNGNYFMERSDLAVPGKGIRFVLSRAYNSLSESWRFNVEQRIYYSGYTGHRSVTIERADGGQTRYFLDEDRRWRPFDRSFDELREQPDGRFLLFTKGSVYYEFAAPADGGRLLALRDRDGNALTLGYDAAGTLERVTDNSGRVYTFSYDASGDHLLSVTDFSGRQIVYSWDQDRLTAVRDLRGNTTHYQYYDSGRLAKVIDPRGNDAISLEYHQGRVSTHIDGDGNTTRFSYGSQDGQPAARADMPIKTSSVGYIFDRRGRLVETINARNVRSSSIYHDPDDSDRVAEAMLVASSRDGNGNPTRYEYSDDGRGNVTRLTDAADRETLMQWKSAEQAAPADAETRVNQQLMTRLTPPGNNVTTSYRLEYSGGGNVKRIDDPLGNPTRIARTAAGLVAAVTDPAGGVTRFEYDADGNQIRKTDALDGVEESTYDALGRVSSRRDKRGHTTRYDYDPAGNLLRTTDALGNVTRYDYDANGNRTQVIDPKGNITTNRYTPGNLLESVSVTVDGTVYTRRFEYDAMNRLVATINENSHARHTEYDPVGNVASRRDALGNTTRYEYDANDNLTKVTDAEGRTVTTRYDALDRRIRVEDGEGNYQTYTYNPQGELSETRDARGQVTRYRYDAAGQLTEVIDPDGKTTRIAYDANGNKSAVTDPNGHTSHYGYDALDRLTSLRDANGNQWTYSYDAMGNKTSERMPNGEHSEWIYDAIDRVSRKTEYAADDSIIRRIDYGYDANSNVETISDAASTIRYRYDELNRVSGVTDAYGQTVSYRYDGVGNLTRLGYPGGKAVDYRYDSGERLSEVIDWLGNRSRYTRNRSDQVTHALLGNGTVVERRFDQAGRLVALKNRRADGGVISDHRLTLDPSGNITRAQTTLPLQPPLPPATGAMSYDDANRLLAGAGADFTHDSAGRIIEQAANGATTEYHFNPRDLIERIVEDGVTTDEYRYNAEDQRIARIHGGDETRYVIDPVAALPDVLAETDAQGRVERYYIYGEGLLEQIDAADQAHFYHYDPTGHTLALTDADQTVTDRYAYSPYGVALADGDTPNPFRYVGRHGVMDDGNGLNYMRARYYKPEVRRFLSLDALLGNAVTPQSLNRFAYVAGNPIMWIDRSGTDAESNTVFTVNFGTNVVNEYVKGATTLETQWVQNYNFARDIQQYPKIKTKFVLAPKSVEVDKYSQGLKSTVGKANAGATAVLTAYTTSTAVYEICKDDTTSIECVARMESQFAGNLAGAIAGGTAAVACFPATPIASAACAVIVSTAVSWVTSTGFESAINNSYDLGVQLHQGAQNVGVRYYNVGSEYAEYYNADAVYKEAYNLGAKINQFFEGIGCSSTCK